MSTENQQIEDEEDGMGGANLDGGGSAERKARARTLQEGENEFRILPGMHSYKATGTWNKYHTVHWGYRLPNRQKPTESYKFPFLCIEDRDRDTKMIRKFCPECERYKPKEVAWKAIVAGYIARNMSEKQAKDQAIRDSEANAQLAAWISDHSPDRKVWMNVEWPNGDFSPLKLSWKAFKALKIKIDATAQKYQINPLDINTGVWFTMNRSSKNAVENTDAPGVAMNSTRDPGDPTGKTFTERLKVTSLNAERRRKALATCPDLAFPVRVLTEQQIRELAECNEEPEVVREIVFRGQPEPQARPAALPPAAAPAASPPKAAASKATPPAEAPPAADPADEDEARLEAQLAQARAAKAARLTASKAAAPALASNHVDVQPQPEGNATSALAGVSDDDFFSNFTKKLE